MNPLQNTIRGTKYLQTNILTMACRMLLRQVHVLAPYSCAGSATSMLLSATDAKNLGTAGAQKTADGVFVFEATSIIFTNATSMVLSGLPNNTAYVQYPPRVNGGIFDTVCLSARHLAAPVACSQAQFWEDTRPPSVLHLVCFSLEDKRPLLRPSISQLKSSL